VEKLTLALTVLTTPDCFRWAERMAMTMIMNSEQGISYCNVPLDTLVEFIFRLEKKLELFLIHIS